MKRHTKLFSVVTAGMLLFTLAASGCGQASTATIGAKQEPAAQAKAAGSTDTAKPKLKTDGSKWKIVVVQENENSYTIEEQQNAVKELGNSGYDATNSNIEIIKLNADQSKCPATVDKIKAEKPDVVVDIAERFTAAEVAKKLEGTQIPIIINQAVEAKDYGFIDDNGMPKNNITGILTMPKDMQARAFEFLNKIAPINGKKTVFLTAPGMFTEDGVRSSLAAVNLKLDKYVTSNYLEDFEQSLIKYTNDNEYGWTLIGINPQTLKSGKPFDLAAYLKWAQENVKKPCVTYWEVAVPMCGVLCGLCVDIPSLGTQSGKMAAKILNGENVKDLKAEAPTVINIALNKKKADELGIQFSAEVMGSAARIYMDYEGKNVVDNTKK